MNAKSLCAVTAALALGLAACGDDDDDEGGTTGTGATTTEEQPAPTGSASETVTLSETEFAIDPAEVSVDQAGVVEFKVQNDGATTHALEVEGADLEEETEDIAAGESATLKVDLPEGTYELYCPIGNHADQGMTAELTVGAGSASSGEDESSGEDDSGGQENSSGGAEAPDDDDNSGGAEAPSSGY